MSAAPFVFLLPGMLCDAEVWRDQIPALQAHYRLAVPVFRGFDSFEAMAQHVLSQAPERFSVVAHSMGGRVAMELLRLVPERIDHCVLMDMGVHPVADNEHERNQRLLLLADEGGLAAVADSWIPFMIHPDRRNDAQLTQAIRAMVLRNTVEDLRGQLLAAEQRADQSRYLRHITHKVHILCGDSDNWNPPELHQQMHEQLSASALVVLQDCGHMAPMERPLQVTELLLRWLQEPTGA